MLSVDSVDSHKAWAGDIVAYGKCNEFTIPIFASKIWVAGEDRRSICVQKTEDALIPQISFILDENKLEELVD